MTGNERITSRLRELVAAKAKAENRYISYRKLAAEVGLAPGTVQAWLNNTTTRFDAAPMLAFCRYFGCEVGDLLRIDNSN